MTPVTASNPSADEGAIARDEALVGVLAPFYALYRTDAYDRRVGWYCSNCDGVSTAMDTMGRIECTDCGNHHKARQWDAAYL